MDTLLVFIKITDGKPQVYVQKVTADGATTTIAFANVDEADNYVLSVTPGDEPIRVHCNNKLVITASIAQSLHLHRPTPMREPPK